MHLEKLVLNNYRIHKGLSLLFDRGVNLIYGDNAVGKTSILEAVQMLICGRPFRSLQLRDLIHVNAEQFAIEAHFEKEGVSHRLSFGSDGQRKKIVHNKTEAPSIARIIGLMPGVGVTPDDVALVKGGPRARRRYLDIQLSQSSQEYLSQLMRYTRAVKQRNQLLRSKNLSTIEIWEKELADAGERIIAFRKAQAKKLEPLTQRYFSRMSRQETPITIQYKTTEGLLSLYKEQREREVSAGSTLFGPHRDDLLLAIDGQHIRDFASLGQMTLIVLALRFAEWDSLKVSTGISPLLLLDDLGMHLDKQRTDGVIEAVHSLSTQVLITSTRLENFPEHWNSLVVLK